jgi:hypothetical protein
MTNLEFRDFLDRLKQNKISNKRFGDFFGYGQTSICHFRNKKKIPKVLIKACEFLKRFEEIGIDLNKIIK